MRELRCALRVAEEVVAIYESKLTNNEKKKILRQVHYAKLDFWLPLEIKQDSFEVETFYDFCVDLGNRLKTEKGLRLV